MKTAEEWAEETGYKNDPVAIEEIKQIQLDAWKQGMTDAADLLQTKHDVSYSNPHNIPVSGIKDILKARDDKTIS